MKKFFRATIFFVFALVISLGLIFFLPKPSLLEGYSFSTAVYDSEQKLLRLGLSTDDKYRVFIPLKDIQPKLQAATLLQEDLFFYWHFGVNPFALFKAAYQTYILKKRRIGASTISMQLANLRFKINSRTSLGKIQQIFHALLLELYYSKDEILEAYLNLAPYGANIEGIGAASLIYFSKKPSQLSLAETLTLSIIPQNPSARNPNNPELITIRKKLEARWLKKHPEDYKEAGLLKLPLVMKSRSQLPFLAPHFVDSIVSNSKVLNTTLDLRLQNLIERITKTYIQSKQKIGVSNAAVLLVDTRDMGIKAMLGSASYFNSEISGQINGTTIYRSPGSTLKPFIYALALDQGLIHPETILKDVPYHFGSYTPDNFDYDFIGPVSASEALVLSRNIPAIYLASLEKQFSLYQLLKATGIRHLLPESYYGLALTLGGAELSMQELVSLYAMLLNDGFWRPLRSLETDPKLVGQSFLSPEASFLTLDMLSKNSAYPQVAWKTGTSSGFRDAWSIGSFGPYVLAVWIGNFSSKPNPAFIGKSLAAPLFFNLIDAIKHEKNLSFSKLRDPRTLNLVQIDVCKASGMLPTAYCDDRKKTWFIPGKSPIMRDNIYREVAISAKTGLRTCHFDKNTRFKVFEFWPSDLADLFKKAGIQRRSPPAFETGCAFNNGTGIKPQISSPMTDLSYIISNNDGVKILLQAVVDGGIKTLHWFINQTYLGTSKPNQKFFWQASKPGEFTIRVVDENGLSDVRKVEIKRVFL